MGQIVELEDYKNKKKKIQDLKKNLEDLIFERDNLLYVVCENIQTSYMLTFGSLTYRVNKAFNDYLRLRRKKSLIQARINRQEKIDLGEIETKLDKEFHEYKEKLQDTISQLKAALEHSRAKALSEEDTALIKKIYKKIVKKIHPDINPNITDKEKRLFVASTESYKNGDLNTLQVIYTIVTSGETEDDESLSLKSMEDEIERLEDLLRKIKSSIGTIKSIPPYTWRIYVEDEEKKAEKLNDLKERLKAYKQAIRTQEEYIKELLEDKKWLI
ncbi:molecular chaperone DnaJ [Anaerococcus degeneri]|uniref:Molecular chaperone DnaJ n=2 Tax=Anaerococcus TaxID=165779 RepID=A0ABS7YYL1_9FIRM|nr:molecular chaperone DnaJ [Anaerococcus degeneri]MBP2015199.1 methyl-accepting chemotaxis protein [Anaerococcus degeneri]MCA2095457.1 molecular chaperone DnaJ [Anaerococcus degeneri]